MCPPKPDVLEGQSGCDCVWLRNWAFRGGMEAMEDAERQQRALQAQNADLEEQLRQMEDGTEEGRESLEAKLQAAQQALASQGAEMAALQQRLVELEALNGAAVAAREQELVAAMAEMQQEREELLGRLQEQGRPPLSVPPLSIPIRSSKMVPRSCIVRFLPPPPPAPLK